MAEQLIPVPPELAKILEDASRADQMQGEVASAAANGTSMKGTAMPKNPYADRFPGVSKGMADYGGALMTGAAGLLSAPLSIPLQAGIGLATEGVNQLAKKEFDPVALGVSTLLPGAARLGGLAVKTAGRGLAKIAGKEGIAQAGAEKVADYLGHEPGLGSRLEDAAKATTTAVPATTMTGTGQAVSQSMNQAHRLGIGQQAADEASGMVRDYARAARSGQPWNYGELFKKANDLNETAGQLYGKDNASASALTKIRNSMLDDLAKVGPEAKTAVNTYRRQKGIDDIVHSFNRANAGRSTKDLLDDVLVGGMLSPVEKQTVQHLANQIGPEGLGKTALALGALGVGGYELGSTKGASAAALIPALAGALVNSGPVGHAIAKSLLGKEGVVNKAVLPALAQMVRGYMGQMAEQ